MVLSFKEELLMYDFKAVTLGIVSTRRDTFPSPKKAIEINGRIMERIRPFVDSLDGVTAVYAADVVPDGLICELPETDRVIEYFREKKVDAVLMLHANFGQEEAVGRLGAALRVPMLLWGPRDGKKGSDEGFRDGDTQCGMFASTRALLRWGVTFTYADNTWLEDPEIEAEIEKFTRVAAVVKAYRNMRILQISSRPRQFLSVKINESELMEKFGFQLTTIETTLLMEKVKKIRENREAELRKALQDWENRYDSSGVPEENRLSMASLVFAIRDFAEQYNCNTVACECWNVPEAACGVSGCMSFAVLEDMGITASCECDVNGAISAAFARAAARGDSAAFFADVTVRHPSNDNAELMWHCGRYPASLTRSEKPKVDPEGQLYHELKKGDITMIRFDGTRGQYYLYADEGRGVDGPKTQGAYVWLEVENWPKWERKLMYGPYIHHMAGVYGKYKDVIREACRYLDIRFDCADIEVEYR